jgi:cyclophilin family peptidyl-prolyl cis-trans isomerase
MSMSFREFMVSMCVITTADASRSPLLSRRDLACVGCLSALLAPAPAPARERAQNARSFGIITWGGAQRCDPTDSACVQNGRLQDASGGSSAVPLSLPEPRASITDRVFLDLSIDRKPAGRLAFGLYGDAAPRSAANFGALCRGVLTSRPGEEPASYSRSSLVQVQRGRFLTGGALTLAGGSTELGLGTARPVYRPVEPEHNDEASVGAHDVAGLLSMRRGGESVTYSVTLGDARSALDRDWIVIGQLVDRQSLELLERLSALPVNKYDASPLVRTEITEAGALAA